MKQAISTFIEVRRELIEEIDRFPASKVDSVLFGEWSLKDVLAHLIGWDEYFARIVGLLKSGEDIPYWGSISSFNEASVNARRDLSWQEVYEEFIAVGEEFVRTYSQIPDNLQETRFWKNRNYSPSRILGVNIHHYAKSHLPEIKKKLVQLQNK